MKKFWLKFKKEILSLKFEYLVFLIILSVATFLRFFQLEERFVFDWDQERDAQVAREIIGGNLTLLGPKAGQAGFFLGPFYNYFLVPFYFGFGGNPIGAAVAASMLGIITVVVIFLVGKYLFNIWVGCLSALLWSFSFVLISQDRLAWNVNLLPLFSLLFLYSLFKLKEGKIYFYPILGFVFGVLIQLHFTALLLLPIFLTFIFLFRPPVKFRYIIVGVIIFLLVNLPTIAFELKNNFLNTKLFLTFFAHPQNPFNFTYLANLERVIDTFARSIVFIFDPFWPPFSQRITFLALFGFLILAILKVKAGKKKLVFFLIWLLVPAAGFQFWRNVPFPEYYFTITFPIVLILVSYLLFLAYQSSIWSKVVIIAAITTFAFHNFAVFTASQNKLSLTYKRQAIKFIVERVGEKPLFLSYSTEINYDTGYRYLLSYYGKESLDIPEVYHYSIVVPINHDYGEREWFFGGIKVIQRSIGI